MRTRGREADVDGLADVRADLEGALPNVPSSTFWPLNAVWVAMRSTSARRCCTSWSRAARSLALFEALADCTASSRMRCRLLVSSPRADSAVCAREDAVVRVTRGDGSDR